MSKNADPLAGRFPVTHSILDPNALADWTADRYLLQKPVQASFYRQSMSHVYRLDTPKRGYFLKVYLSSRHSRAAIQAEVDFINVLRQDDIPVAEPVADRDGSWLNAIRAPEGTRWVVLSTAVEGIEPQEIDPAHSRLFGQLAGRIHNCADRSGKIYRRPPHDETYLFAAPLKLIEHYFPHRRSDLDFLGELAESLKSELRDLLSKESPVYGICHGDLHTGNALIDPQRGLTLFDFDSFGTGWRAIDIGVYRASFKWMDLSPDTQLLRERFWTAFLEGYHRQRSLGENELQAVQLSPPIRHLELMGLTMRYWAPYEGTSWITDAYLDHHLDWFQAWSDCCR